MLNRNPRVNLISRVPLLSAFRGVFRILSTILDGDFCKNIVNSWKPLDIFARICILDIWQGSEHTTDSEHVIV